MKESLVVKACIDWLFAHGCYVWRNNTGVATPRNSPRPVRYGLNGSADIIGLLPRSQGGRFIAVECKAGTNDLSIEQERFRERILSKGGLYIIARNGVDALEAMKAQII